MYSIHNVSLVLPDRVLKDGWVAFEDGKISGHGQGTPPSNSAKTVDGESRYLAPGFIDTHIHGGNGADFLDATPEAFLTATDYHLSQGTTSLCPTLATASYEHFATALAAWETARHRSRARLLPVHLEGPHLAPSKAGAQNPKLLHPATESEIAWLEENAARIAQMTVAPELQNALTLIERGSKVGIVMSAGHCEAREPEILPAITRGVTKVTHLFNAMTYAAKNGIFRQPGLAEFALVCDDLACELVADGFHAAPALMKLAYRTKGPGKIALISDALAGTGLPLGSRFMLGKLECKVGDGYCMLADGSALAGSATRSIDQVRIMTQQVNVPLHEAVRMATDTPARLVGEDDQLGSIQPGKAADFVAFDDNFRVHRVWVAGEPVWPTRNFD
jgi:N-acetylglucosamine-6-phosphate deacetylase